MKSIDVGVVLVNYNNYSDTISATRQYLTQIKVSIHVIIVDNDSPNDSFKILSLEFQKNKRVTVLRSDKNGGFAYGNNVGIRFSQENGFAFTLLSNSDIEISTVDLIYDLIERYKSLEKPAFISPLMDLNGLPAKYPAWRVPTIWYDFLDSFMFTRVFGYRKTLLYGRTHTEFVPVDCLPGSFLLCSTSVFDRMGLLDEGTFLYCEERIIAVKVKKLGLKNYLITNKKYNHLESQTISSYHSILSRRKILYNSRLYFHRKYGRFPWMSSLLIPIFLLSYVELIIWSLFKKLRG